MDEELNIRLILHLQTDNVAWFSARLFITLYAFAQISLNF